MSSFKDKIIQIVQLYDKTEANEEVVKKLLKDFASHGKGVQNAVVEEAAKHFKYFGKNDLKEILRNLRNGKKKDDPSFEEDEIKPSYLVADAVIENFHLVTVEETGKLMVFNRQAYRLKKTKLKEFMSKYIASLNAPHDSTYRNAKNYLKHLTIKSREEFNYDPYVMVFCNGVYDFNKNGFGRYKYPEKMYFFYELATPYLKGNYDCPKFKKALVSWIDEKTTPFHRKGTRTLLMNDMFEAMALCMTCNVDLKASFLNYGDPNCGKTQFSNILKKLIGYDNVSGTSLQRMGKNEFGVEGMEYKILNSCGDLPSNLVSDTGIFKAITGGDEQTESEIKGGRKHYPKLVCKFWFNANKIPRLNKHDDIASYDRFIMIHFPNIFKRGEGDTKEGFWKSIVEDESEMQGIVHECVKAYKRLLKRGNFREVLRQDTVHTWKYHSDEAYAFFCDFCEKSDGRLLVDEAWERFSQEYPGRGKQMLTKGWSRLGILRKQMRVDGKQKDFYYGVSWKGSIVEINDIEPILEGGYDIDEFE